MAGSSELWSILSAGIDAVRPSNLFPPILNEPYADLGGWLTSNSRFLLACGKASVDSAKSILGRVACDDYFVLGPFADPEGKLAVHKGSHPIPDQNSYQSATDLVRWLKSLPAGGSLLVILSGGTSALCVLPLQQVDLQAKMAVNDLLIRSGATIHEMNTVRKHLSAVKGGQLASVASHLNTRVLVISDVIGDDLSVIGSGPFYPDPSTFLDAKNVLEKYGLWSKVPQEVRKTIDAGCAGAIPETPKPGSTAIQHTIIASNRTARDAAARRASTLGFNVLLVEDPLQGDVKEAADVVCSTIRKVSGNTAIIFGGEVTVRLRGTGKGGRNQHLALVMTERIRDSEVLFGAAGTDGIDGNSTAAGAWTDGKTFQKASGSQSFNRALKSFDSYHYFHSIGQNVITGPTGTNVMDLYIALT